jgi:hypothetical protein
MLRFFLLVLAAAAAAAQSVVIQPCSSASPASPFQVFTPQACSAGACQYASAGSPGMCISAGPNPVATSQTFLAPCGASGLVQTFSPQPDGTVQAVGTSGLCWNVDGGAGFPAGTPIILYNCGSRGASAPAANDVFTFLPTSQIYANGSSLCLDASPPPHVWAWVAGQVVGPTALPDMVMAVADAKALCLATKGCWSITYAGPLNPAQNQTISFKMSTAVQTNAGWQSYLGCGVNAPCT